MKRPRLQKPPTLPDGRDAQRLAEWMRGCLSPQAVAAIAAYIQPVRTMDEDLLKQVRWFRAVLVGAVGGEDRMNELCDENGR